MVCIRSRVSGPLSLMVCLPIRPNRSSTVSSSTSDAVQSSTPRGLKNRWNAGWSRG
jgi:hypothetical protein